MAEFNPDVLVSGDLVCLKDLTKATHLNGRLGVLGSETSEEGRFAVKLFVDGDGDIEPKRQSVAVKAENLKKIRRTMPHPTTRDLLRATCGNCQECFLMKKMLDCSKCLLVSYCSQECQRNHWGSAHRLQCDVFRHARKARSAPPNLAPRDKADILLRLSCRFQDKQDFGAMETILIDGIKELGPHWEFSSMYCNLAIALDAQDRTDEAVDVMRQAIGVEEQTPGATDQTLALRRCSLAYFLERQGDYKNAIKEYEVGLQLNPALVEAWINVGRLYHILDQDVEAEAALLHFLEESEESPFVNPQQKNVFAARQACILLARVCEKRTRQSMRENRPPSLIVEATTRVISVLKKAVKLDPGNTDFYEIDLPYSKKMVRGEQSKRKKELKESLCGRE